MYYTEFLHVALNIFCIFCPAVMCLTYVLEVDDVEEQGKLHEGHLLWIFILYPIT